MNSLSNIARSSGLTASRRTQLARLLLAAVLVLAAVPVFAQTPTLPRKTNGRQVALLIGCEKYQKVTPLMYVDNDVQKLAETLRDRGGFDEVVEVSDLAKEATKIPHKSTIMSVVPDFLQKRGPNDTVIVYFSGHGFRDTNGVMYLAPLDANPADLSGSGVPVAWFRDQIAKCKSKLKLLILDACHAGSTKGAGAESNLSPQDLALFEQLEGVVTLASSTAEQPSIIWDEKQHSLFTYWLNQGLKGHADDDGNGEINIDELYEYLHQNVTQSAQARMSRSQTPVRKIGLGTPGTPTMFYLRPQKLKQVIAEMATQLADSIADRKLDSVGVLEFTNNTKLGELLGADYGLLGKYCAEQLEERLVKEQRNRFKVVNRRTLQQALQQQNFGVSDLASKDALQSLSKRAGGMPVVAVGMLNGRAGRMINLRCQLLETSGNDVAAVVGGNAWLSESEWGMLGKSVTVKPEDRRPEPPKEDEPPRRSEDVVVDRMDQKADGPHPLSDPKSPYRVWLQVNGQERKGEFRGNKYYVPLKKGEVYVVYVENNSKELTLMRLLVDGLNTMFEEDSLSSSQTATESTNGAPVPQDKGLSTYIIGKHVNLEEARGWVLDPNDKERNDWARLNRANPNKYSVQGFVTKLGKDGKMAQFTVVDASQSLAARQKFTSQIGVITAAFYKGTGVSTDSASRKIGTDAGSSIDVPLVPVKADFGALQSIIHIHYYDPAEGIPAN